MSVLSLVSRRPLRDPRPDRPRWSRWAPAAAGITIAAAGLLPAEAGVETGERPVFVPITPCRLVDTRPAPETVGPRAMPLRANESYAVQVRGANGNCTIPADAVGVVMNVAAIEPSAGSFLTVYPSDAVQPLAANLNWIAGQPPVSNAATADLSVDGRVSFYNLAGTVHIAADIVGYFVDHGHDDRYYTKTQTDAAVSAALAAAVDPSELAAAVATAVDPDELAAALAAKADRPTGVHVLKLDPLAFIPTLPGAAYSYNTGADLRGTTSDGFVVAAAVQLPHGATVTSISASVLDNSPLDIGVELLRNHPDAMAYSTMGQASTSGTPQSVILTDNTISFPTIDNTVFSYVVRVGAISIPTRLYGVTITYTLP